MLAFGNKEFRNLQEQVLKNMRDIQDLEQGVTVLADFGIKVVGQVESSSELPDPSTYEGEYGDAYIVGTSAPYEYYIFTRAFEGQEEPTWFNLGIFPQPGPQGPKGDKGDKGEDATVRATASATTLSPGSQASVEVINAGTGTNRVVTFTFGIPQGVQGIQGAQGPKGDTGDTGPQGPRGEKGESGNLYTIVGQVNSENDLPSPANVSRTSAYLVGAQEPYNVYVIIGTTNLEWINLGPIATTKTNTYLFSTDYQEQGSITQIMMNDIANEEGGYFIKVGNIVFVFSEKTGSTYRYIAFGKDGNETQFAMLSLNASTLNWRVIVTYLVKNYGTYNELIVGLAKNLEAPGQTLDEVFDFQASAGTKDVETGVSEFITLNGYSEVVNGAIVDSNATKYIVTGFNQWDEEWEVGYISDTDGQPVSGSTTIRPKNYIQVISNTIYYIKSTNNSRIFFYNSNHELINLSYNVNNTTFTTPTNCKYIKFLLGTSYGTTYNHDICINISHSGNRNGEYESFVRHEYNLPGITLRSAGDVHDTLTPNGVLTRRVNHVTLNGSENWSRTDTNDVATKGYYFYTEDFTDAFNLSAGSEVSNIISNIATAGTPNQIYGGSEANPIIISFWSSRSRICIYSRTLTSNMTVAEFKTWLASNNIELNYQITIPTVEQTVNTFVQATYINDYGTQAFDVKQGATIFYMRNLKDKLIHLPSLASTNGTYAIKQENSEMSLVPITLNDIVDSNGNKRFVEGNGTNQQISGITFNYSKFSLSGTHLMFVLAGTLSNGISLTNGQRFVLYDLPQWVHNKIIPLFAQNNVDRKQVTFFSDDFSVQTASFILEKIPNTNRISITHIGTVTLTKDRNFRIQFDLLIDQD